MNLTEIQAKIQKEILAGNKVSLGFDSAEDVKKFKKTFSVYHYRQCRLLRGLGLSPDATKLAYTDVSETSLSVELARAKLANFKILSVEPS